MLPSVSITTCVRLQVTAHVFFGRDLRVKSHCIWWKKQFFIICQPSSVINVYFRNYILKNGPIFSVTTPLKAAQWFWKNLKKEG